VTASLSRKIDSKSTKYCIGLFDEKSTKYWKYGDIGLREGPLSIGIYVEYGPWGPKMNLEMSVFLFQGGKLGTLSLCEFLRNFEAICSTSRDFEAPHRKFSCELSGSRQMHRTKVRESGNIGIYGLWARQPAH
jgi:hypothetical protein